MLFLYAKSKYLEVEMRRVALLFVGKYSNHVMWYANSTTEINGQSRRGGGLMLRSPIKQGVLTRQDSPQEWLRDSLIEFGFLKPFMRDSLHSLSE
jgi:hypothetical protein